jgi:hypothetical protein
MLASDQRHRHVLASVKASILYYNKVGATKQMTQGMTKQTSIETKPLYPACSMHRHLNISSCSSPKHDDSLLRPLCSWLESLSITINVDEKAIDKLETTPTIVAYIWWLSWQWSSGETCVQIAKITIKSQKNISALDMQLVYWFPNAHMWEANKQHKLFFFLEEAGHKQKITAQLTSR